MLLFYIINSLKKEIRPRDVFCCSGGVFFADINYAHCSSIPRLGKSWKNFTRSICLAEQCIFFLLSRINPSASGQVFVCFVKFSSNFLVFSCSSEILPKLASGILTATSRLWHLLFDFLSTELVQPRFDLTTRCIYELHTEICQRNFMQ